MHGGPSRLIHPVTGPIDLRSAELDPRSGKNLI